MLIYIVTNKINGKVYVGKTNYSLSRRWQQHLISAFSKDSRLLLHAALRKYGSENFEISVVTEVPHKDELNKYERYFIAKYRSFPPKLGFGYNMSPGGDGGPEIRLGTKQSESAKQKISDYRKLNPVVAGSETAKKISQALIGRGFTPEWSQRKSAAQVGSKNNNFKDLLGTRIGKLLVLKWVGGGHWDCQCDCGRRITPTTSNLLKSTGTRSCGCSRFGQSRSEEAKQKMRHAALRRWAQ